MTRFRDLRWVVATCVLAVTYGLLPARGVADEEPAEEKAKVVQPQEKQEEVKKNVQEVKEKKEGRRKARRKRESQELREIRVAVLPIGATSEVKIDPDALTDQIHMLMSTLPQVTLVDRSEVENVVQEHQMALSGMVDLNEAVKLGRMLSAEYIMVGRASKVGKTYYLVLKLIDVETTKQTTISAKGPAEPEEDEEDFVEERGMSVVLDNLSNVLPQKIRQFQTAPFDAETLEKLDELREIVKPFRGMRFLVTVPESHVRHQVNDPAAQMMITHFLSHLDIEYVVPKDPPNKWKERLLQTGTYDKQKVDYLVDGKGTSEFAGRIQGLVSCRARVELELVKLPGRSVLVVDRGVGAGIDLTESLSSKMALEKAGVQAVEALLRRAVEKLERAE